MARGLVFVFARAPLYGAVKSRLARDIGALEALTFYRHCLSSLVQRLSSDPRLDVVLATTPQRFLSDDGLWPRGIPRIDQGAGDLGQRMIRTLKRASHRPAVLVGTDIPDACATLVLRAHHILGQADFVLGPVRDGGYWLIGARHPSRLPLHLLDGVAWSTASARQQTSTRLANLGRVGELQQVLTDVDDGDTFRHMRARLPSRAWLPSRE
jgi:hypothetical protein